MLVALLVLAAILLIVTVTGTMIYVASLIAINSETAIAMNLLNQYDAFRYEHNMKIIAKGGAKAPLASVPPPPTGPGKPPTNVVILRKKSDDPSDKNPRR